MTLQVEIWSDIVCPWCYLGKARFEHAVAETGLDERVAVTHRAFQLDPAAPVGAPTTQLEMLVTRYGRPAEEIRGQWAQLAALGAAEGLEYNFEGGLTGNTFAAHRLVRHAREQGLQGPVLDRLFRAQFTEQRSIFDAPSLVALGAEAGLDAAGAEKVLTDGTYSAQVQADVEAARAYGANGVPFFVIDQKYAVSGAQSRAVFADALSRADSEA